METTFISIHDLSQDARLLYISNSITDILGWKPSDIVGKSCWEYFHPDEIPFARTIHGRGVQLDKAAVLNYCQIKNKIGVWIGCECVFTVVYDVLVSCTSIYRHDAKSQRRAEDAPIIRQLFSSSPRDPRYHMLSYISAKFKQLPQASIHEPRAALFLNRFTRTSTIMYATNGLEKLLGISADELYGKSFYYCIQENCLSEAVRCLESAKENDSIAYLRFWYRDPRDTGPTDHDEIMSEAQSSDQDDDEGGVGLEYNMDIDSSDHAVTSDSSYSNQRRSKAVYRGGSATNPNSRTTSDNSTDLDRDASGTIFDQPATVNSSTSSLGVLNEGGQNFRPRRTQTETRQIELEAVVSCTSDGLVVILRAARPFLPTTVLAPQRTVQPVYTNGLFASPWAAHPIMPPLPQHNLSSNPYYYSGLDSGQATAWSTPGALTGPPLDDFMASIREVAVFAWSLTGINGSLTQYSRGKPRGYSIPVAGVPVWEPRSSTGPEADYFNGLYGRRPPKGSNFIPPETMQVRKQLQNVSPLPSIGSQAPGADQPVGFALAPQNQDVNAFWPIAPQQGVAAFQRVPNPSTSGWSPTTNLLAFGTRQSRAAQSEEVRRAQEERMEQISPSK